jgi:hypothetical protein
VSRTRVYRADTWARAAARGTDAWPTSRAAVPEGVCCAADYRPPHQASQSRVVQAIPAVRGSPATAAVRAQRVAG